MRILHTSDWHLGKNLEGHSRLEEQEAFLSDFVTLVEENQVDLVLIAGDVYDTPNPPAKAEKLFYDTLKKVSNQGQRLIVVIAGNHDNPERLVAAGPLAREHGIIMAGTPKTVLECGQYGEHQILRSGQGFVELEMKGEKCVILLVPYPSEKRLEETIYGEMEGEEERLKSYSDRIQMLFNTLSENFREDTINLVTSHLFAMGSEEAGSERNIQLGGSFIVDGSCFPKEAQYVALGHVHKPQIVPGTDKKARYAGSPIHYNKKEISFQKSCYLVDVKTGEEARITEVGIPVYKPIEIWKCNSIEEAIKACEEKQRDNSWVYLEIKSDRYIREDEIKTMKSTKKDILEILPKLENTEEEIEDNNFLEKSFEEIFSEFYRKERSVEPQQEVMDLLLSIVSEEDEHETN